MHENIKKIIETIPPHYKLSDGLIKKYITLLEKEVKPFLFINTARSSVRSTHKNLIFSFEKETNTKQLLNVALSCYQEIQQSPSETIARSPKKYLQLLLSFIYEMISFTLERHNQSKGLGKIPKEVLEHNIFSCLTLHDLHIIKNTCREFREISKTVEKRINIQAPWKTTTKFITLPKNTQKVHDVMIYRNTVTILFTNNVKNLCTSVFYLGTNTFGPTKSINFTTFTPIKTIHKNGKWFICAKENKTEGHIIFQYNFKLERETFALLHCKLEYNCELEYLKEYINDMICPQKNMVICLSFYENEDFLITMVNLTTQASRSVLYSTASLNNYCILTNQNDTFKSFSFNKTNGELLFELNNCFFILDTKKMKIIWELDQNNKEPQEIFKTISESLGSSAKNPKIKLYFKALEKRLHFRYDNFKTTGEGGFYIIKDKDDENCSKLAFFCGDKRSNSITYPRQLIDSNTFIFCRNNHFITMYEKDDKLIMTITAPPLYKLEPTPI